jgi:hypothetical protein
MTRLRGQLASFQQEAFAASANNSRWKATIKKRPLFHG